MFEIGSNMLKLILSRFGYISKADADIERQHAINKVHNIDLSNQAYAAVIAFSRACPGAGFRVVSDNVDKTEQIERAKLLAKHVLEIDDVQEQELFSRQFVSCVMNDVRSKP